MPISPIDPAAQAAVSGQFAQPGRGQSFGEILDAIVATKAKAQEQALGVFEAITRGNPALAALIAAQPGFTAAATRRPSLRRADEPATDIAGFVERGAQKFASAPAPLDLKPEFRLKALELLTGPERNPVNSDLLLTYLGASDPASVQAARDQLLKTAPKSLERLSRQGKTIDLLETAELAVEFGVAPDIATAMRDLLSSTPEKMAQLDLELKLLRLRQDTLELAQMEDRAQADGFLDEQALGSLRDRLSRERAELREVMEKLGTAEIGVAKAERATAEGRKLTPFLALTSPDELRLLRQHAADLRQSVSEIERVISRFKTRKSGGPEAAPTTETPEQRKARLKALIRPPK